MYTGACHYFSSQKYQKSKDLMASTKFIEILAAFSQKFCYHILSHAEVAQLVEHNLAKVGVAGSSPVFRSIVKIRAVVSLRGGSFTLA